MHFSSYKETCENNCIDLFREFFLTWKIFFKDIFNCSFEIKGDISPMNEETCCFSKEMCALERAFRNRYLETFTCYVIFLMKIVNITYKNIFKNQKSNTNMF